MPVTPKDEKVSEYEKLLKRILDLCPIEDEPLCMNDPPNGHWARGSSDS